MSRKPLCTSALFFVAPRQVEIREEDLRPAGPEELLIQTLCSAISPGTEMLVYRGEAPQDLAADANIPSLAGQLRYPLKYGYAVVGRVVEAGSPALAGWVGRLIFCFQPHQTHFIAAPSQVIPIPDGFTPEQALFLPNVETAVNFLMDGQPVVGERVAVFGQGIVGLLTVALLAQFPLETLIAFDPLSPRREASLAAGAQRCLPSRFSEAWGDFEGFFDLTYELSGSPAALNDALAVTGFDGRVVIGSWYGQKPASLDLGGRFHRARLRLISSQVSTLAPRFSGRWDKPRRFAVAWEMIRRVRPERWITHRVPFGQVGSAYDLLDRKAGEAIQVVLVYEDRT